MVMDATTGKVLVGDAADAQMVGTILSTRIGTRVGRREFGSELRELMDQPMNSGLRQRMLGATALALMRWMPGLVLDRVQIVRDGEGSASVILDRRRANGTVARLVAPLNL
jgi:phage baseplate assembly protein W